MLDDIVKDSNGQCYLRWGDKRKKLDYTVVTKGADCYPWKEHFAWLPVTTITGLRAWGVKIYKRKVWVVWGAGFHVEPETQYATLFEILADENTSSNS